MTVLACVMEAVSTLSAKGHPLVSPVHPAKCQYAAGVAVSATFAPDAYQPSAAVTEPLPLVCAVRRYCVCQFHVSAASFVSVSVTLVAEAYV